MKSVFKKLTMLALVGTMSIPLFACNKTMDNQKYDIPSTVVGTGANGDQTLRLPDYKVTNKEVKLLTHKTDVQQLSSLKETYGAQLVIEVVPQDQRISRLQQLVNSGDSPDLFDYDYMPSLVTKGYVQPITKYIDFDTPLWSGVKESHLLSTYNNEIYMVDPICGRYGVVWYNKDIFNQAGEQLPSELLKLGKWDWNTFRDLSKKLTVAESNGDVSQWGGALDEIDGFLYSTGKHIITYVDGQPKNMIKSPEITRAMNYFVDIFTKDKTIYPGSDARDQFAKGKIAMLEGYLWYRDPFKDMLKNNSIAFVPVPKDPSADKYYLQESFAGYYIPKGAKNPVGAAAYLSCYRYERLDAAKIKEDFDNLAKTVNWNRECQDMLDDMQGSKYTPVMKTWISFGLGDLFGDIFSRPRDGEPWATIAEEVSPKIDEKIELATSN